VEKAVITGSRISEKNRTSGTFTARRIGTSTKSTKIASAPYRLETSAAYRPRR
jgi:hypothetical protein